MTLPATIPPRHAVLSVSEMYAADQAATAGISSKNLMENAGTAVARVVMQEFSKPPVVVLCGPGSNGGDGFVAARILAEAGWSVRLALLGQREDLQGDSAHHAAKWHGAVEALTPALLDHKPLVIDALFGAGLNRPLEGVAREIIARINDDKLICVAVDVPSGVCGDSGEIRGVAPKCAATVTFFRRKPAHLLYPARAFSGEITVADIGIPDSVLAAISPATAHNAPGLWRLPQPGWDHHKYSRGHALVIGSAQTTGAARLAARGARRAGAGVVTFAVPRGAETVYALDAAGAFVRPMDNGEDLAGLLADARRNGVLIGPGTDAGPQTAVNVLQVLHAGRAVVLDAGALGSFQDDPEQLFEAIKRSAAPVVITPHEGEFTRLFGAGQGSKLDRARQAAKRSGAVVVLKGADTVVAAPDNRAAVSDNGPPWLATAGSGDVLAGFIVGLLVQGMPGWEGACAAVWLHGACGSAVGRGLIAEDLPEALPKVLKSL